ncbi:hypothetical protein [Paenibacillus sp. 481]|uniref:hypothetical protein n=1 Tax=Paenibacillus sp. 481 TaxID=2835869 RepID=UPI003FA694DD
MRWHSDGFFFDTLREAEEWADSISNEIYGRIYDGYVTPDHKIAYALAFFLASVHNFRVRTDKCFINDTKELRYKVWIEVD